MKCPTCHSSMIVVEYEKIELDYCMSCCGLWFDAGELDLLLEAAGQDELLPSTTAPDKHTQIKEQKRKCPTCGKTMGKMHFGDTPPVMVDVCPQGGGIWFDGGELHQILEQLPGSDIHEDSQNKIITFLKDLFKSDTTISINNTGA